MSALVQAQRLWVCRPPRAGQVPAEEEEEQACWCDRPLALCQTSSFDSQLLCVAISMSRWARSWWRRSRHMMGQSLVEEEQARASELSSMRQVLKMRVEGAKAESEAAQAQLQQIQAQADQAADAVAALRGMMGAREEELADMTERARVASEATAQHRRWGGGPPFLPVTTIERPQTVWRSGSASESTVADRPRPPWGAVSVRLPPNANPYQGVDWAEASVGSAIGELEVLRSSLAQPSNALEAEASVESTVGELEVLRSSLAATVAEGQQQAATKEQEVGLLQQQLLQVQQTLVDEEAARAISLSLLRAALDEKEETSRAEAEASHAELQRVQAQAAEAAAAVEELKGLMSTREEELDVMTARAERASEATAQAEASVESTASELAELQTSMAATVAEGEEFAAAKQQQVAALQEQLQQVQQTMVEEEDARSIAVKALQGALEERVEAARAESEAAKAELQQIHSQADEALAAVEALKGLMGTREQELQEMTAQAAKASEATAQAEASVQSTASELADAKAALAATAAEAQQEVAAKVEEVASLKEQLQQVQETSVVKEEEISLELSRVQGALEAKAQAAREESEAAQAQLQQAQAQAEQAAEAVSALKGVMGTREQELAQMTERAARASEATAQTLRCRRRTSAGSHPAPPSILDHILDHIHPGSHPAPAPALDHILPHRFSAEASIESTVGQLAELKSAMAATVAEGAEQAAAKQQEVAALQEQLQQAQELIVVEEAGQATELRKLKEALEAKVQAARAESEAAKAELLQARSEMEALLKEDLFAALSLPAADSKLTTQLAELRLRQGKLQQAIAKNTEILAMLPESAVLSMQPKAAQRVAKLQSVQADLQYALDEIDQGGFTDKTTLQTASGYRRELAPVAHELDGLLRGAMTPLMLANESDLRSNVAEKRAELNTLNAEVARLAKLQAEGGSAGEADVDAGLRVAVLSRVREVVAEREAALKQQMSSRELELQSQLSSTEAAFQQKLSRTQEAAEAQVRSVESELSAQLVAKAREATAAISAEREAAAEAATNAAAVREQLQQLNEQREEVARQATLLSQMRKAAESSKVQAAEQAAEAQQSVASLTTQVTELQVTLQLDRDDEAPLTQKVHYRAAGGSFSHVRTPFRPSRSKLPQKLKQRRLTPQQKAVAAAEEAETKAAAAAAEAAAQATAIAQEATAKAVAAAEEAAAAKAMAAVEEAVAAKAAQVASTSDEWLTIEEANQEAAAAAAAAKQQSEQERYMIALNKHQAQQAEAIKKEKKAKAEAAALRRREKAEASGSDSDSDSSFSPRPSTRTRSAPAPTPAPPSVTVPLSIPAPKAAAAPFPVKAAAPAAAATPPVAAAAAAAAPPPAVAEAPKAPAKALPQAAKASAVRRAIDGSFSSMDFDDYDALNGVTLPVVQKAKAAPARGRAKKAAEKVVNLVAVHTVPSDNVGASSVLGVRMVSAAATVPHDEKAEHTRTLWIRPPQVEKGGEDAFMISAAGFGAIGVADGVGGWLEVGVDPALYSKSVMAACQQALEATEGREAVREVMEYAQSSSSMQGSCTVTLAVLREGGSLEVGNLGDSGCRIIRNTDIVFATKAQHHQYNMPFQMASAALEEDTDTAADADLTEFSLRVGDVVVVGSDGVFDNLWDYELLELVTTGLRLEEEAARSSRAIARSAPFVPGAATAEALARSIASMAQVHARDASLRTPWAVELSSRPEASWVNKMFPRGGKMDDITVVIAVVTPASTA
ncbi:MAG: hypothetical protein WDW38_002069 [Sanguina aurantia]